MIVSIEFSCEHCGHKIDVDERLAGKHGTCKHCGHAIIVPNHSIRADADEPLLLRPIDTPEPRGPHAHLLDARAPLVITAATEEPHTRPEAISGSDDPGGSVSGDYTLRATGKERHSSAGPPPFWVNAPSLLARSIARRLRTLRDWIYLVSVIALVLALIGFLFQLKSLLHVGVVVAIAANIGILVVGLAYLVTLPFKEGMGYGLANLLIPFYAVYYWYTHWPKMKPAVQKTFGSFVPILIAAVAFFSYEEGPKLIEEVEREVPIIEEKIEEAVKKIDVGPIKQVEEKVEGVIDSKDDTAKEPAR